MEKKYLNIHELAQYIGFSEQTIYQMVSQARIPYIKMGRLRFDKQRIDQWLREKSVEPRSF